MDILPRHALGPHNEMPPPVWVMVSCVTHFIKMSPRGTSEASLTLEEVKCTCWAWTAASAMLPSVWIICTATQNITNQRRNVTMEGNVSSSSHTQLIWLWTSCYQVIWLVKAQIVWLVVDHQQEFRSSLSLIHTQEVTWLSMVARFLLTYSS